MSKINLHSNQVASIACAIARVYIESTGDYRHAKKVWLELSSLAERMAQASICLAEDEERKAKGKS